MEKKNEIGKGEILQKLPALFRTKEDLEKRLSETEIRYRNLVTEYDPQIRDLSRMADEFAIEFRRLYGEASDAYAQGDRALAKQLSIEGHDVQAECEALNHQTNGMRAELRSVLDLIDLTRQRSQETRSEISVLSARLKTLRSTTVRGFERSGLLDNIAVERILDSLPQQILKHVKSIEYKENIEGITARGKTYSALGETGWNVRDEAIIRVARQVGATRDEALKKYASVLAHEVGHVVYEKVLSDHEKAEWFVLSDEATSYLSTSSMESDVEDFAEAFRLFVFEPGLLEQTDQKKYRYIKGIHSRIRSQR